MKGVQTKFSEFSKICPGKDGHPCGNIQYYSSQWALEYAIEHNNTCKHCSRKIYYPDNHSWCKLCPGIDADHPCGKLQTYYSKSELLTAIKNNTKCYECANNVLEKRINHSIALSGKKHTEEQNKAKSIRMRGYKPSLEHIENNRLSHLGQKSWNKGVPQTEEAKKKNRQSNIEYARKHGIRGFKRANPHATEFFEFFNAVLGLTGQHDGHPLGEKEILQYSIDYYFETEDYVFIAEYDEKRHFNKPQIKKDIKRQKEIEKYIGNKCIFLRYDEPINRWYTY